MNSASPVAVGIGEILWDLLPAGKQLGGAPGNFAYHMAALGAKSVVVSSVGNDALGGEIEQRLDALKLDRRYLARDPSRPTGTVEVTLDQAGVPSYIIHENVAWDFIPEDERLLKLARRCDVACYGTLAQRNAVSRGTIRGFIEHMPPRSIRLFDVNLRQHYFDDGVIRDLLAISNVVKLNDEELPRVASMLGLPREPDRALREMMERFALRLAALTRGAAGSLLVSPEGSSDHRGFPTKIVDTVGAGDAFSAAVAMGLLREQPLEEINIAANRLAAYVCSQAGATPPIPRDLIPSPFERGLG